MYTNISFLSTVYNERRSGLPLPPEDGSPRPLISMEIDEKSTLDRCSVFINVI
jgi:hypothetical protein